MSETPKDAKGIFLAALDIQDAADRAAFVDRSCDGDAALRRRVEDLLHALQRIGWTVRQAACRLSRDGDYTNRFASRSARRSAPTS